MRTPLVLVTAALTVAILLAASFVIVTGTRGEDGASDDAASSVIARTAGRLAPASPAAK